MFTGIVEEMGRVLAIEPRQGGARLRIAARLVVSDAREGDSIAVDGCCLTALEPAVDSFAVDAVPETLRRTTLGALVPGATVNLERPVRLDQRLGGHLVQGHVDGVGEVRWVRREGEGTRIAIALPKALARYVAEKGSIAVDGASLTVAACSSSEFEVALIPHTLRVTVAGLYEAGRRVNLEVDLLARYVARLTEIGSEGGTA
jgi:riboflavin synthase